MFQNKISRDYESQGFNLIYLMNGRNITDDDSA